MVLNLTFVVVEVIASFISNSAALLADAGHNLGDVLSLLLAWGASILASRPAGPGYTYGLKSSSILFRNDSARDHQHVGSPRRAESRDHFREERGVCARED